MDQSRSWHSALKSPLVERPDLQSPQQRRLYAGLTLAFWVFWFYLWVPVLALLAWSLGIEQAYKYMVVLGGYRDVVRLAAFYGLVILLLGGGLVLWAVYNILRFRGVEKRTAARPVTSSEIGNYFGQAPAAVARWQGGRRLYVKHDDVGGIVAVEILADGAATPD
jgi:biofilm PGA synthesis protein PgaD